MTRAQRRRLVAVVLALAVAAGCASSTGSGSGGTRATRSTSADGFTVTEFPITYPAQSGAAASTTSDTEDGAAGGSTHEITFDQYAEHPTDLWVTNQNSDALVRISLDGHYQVMSMPTGSGPHGSAFDAYGRLWLTLQFAHALVQVDAGGHIQQTFDLTKACASCAGDRKPGPHGLSIGPDGKTVWFAAKDGGYVGAVRPDGTMSAYPLPDPNALPIYIAPGPDGNMWFTELAANKIGRVTPAGVITEFTIPTPNSRPISLHAGPDSETVWFSEEAGSRIGRVNVNDGSVTEFEIPRSQPNLILAALIFDGAGNLWVQQYVDQAHPGPTGADKILRVAASFFGAPTSPVPASAITTLTVPSRKTVMHRIIVGPRGDIWFTELNVNAVGRITQP